MLDLIVIGAGLTGLMAAYTAAKAGLKVKVIAKGLGSMHWTAGTVEVLGYLYDSSSKLNRSATLSFASHASRLVREPLEQIPDLVKQKPEHPYGRLNGGQIAGALEMFVDLTREMDLPYGGATVPGENLLLPSPAGAMRPVFLAPEGQLAGDLGRPEPMLIVGFEGMHDFYPQLIAENLNKLGYQARPLFLPMGTITDRRDSSTVHLAQALDDADRRGKLLAKLQQLADPVERIGLPAILGLDDHAGFMAEAKSDHNLTLFEIPTLPPSVPGVRLFQHLRRKLLAMGVPIEPGMEVISAETKASEKQAQLSHEAPEKIHLVKSETSSRPLAHRAGKYLLATGGILGGGIKSDASGRVWEVIFDLPLSAPQDRTEWFQADFLDPQGHPIFNGGVPVDKGFQPIDGQGNVLYSNLWAAGNGLAHCDPILERSLEGIGIITGMAAAQAIAGHGLALHA